MTKGHGDWSRSEEEEGEKRKKKWGVKKKKKERGGKGLEPKNSALWEWITEHSMHY